MQWNCPHCGISLAIAQDSVGAGWSFSRCYKCGGFALIRKAEVNVIKVDKAPPGEMIILPEASKDPTADGLLSAGATAQLNRHTDKRNTEKKPTSEKKAELPPFPMPPPLPQTSVNHMKNLRMGVLMSGLFAIISGIYLFAQGQTLWQKMHDIGQTTSRGPEQKNSSPILNTSLRERSIAPIRQKILTSDIYANDDAKPQQEARTEIVDRVQQSAMAPLKTVESSKLPQEVLTVKLRSKKASVHSGPGMEFPISGVASSEDEYLVSEINNRWFKLLPKKAQPAVSLGWIQNEFVQILTSSAGSGIATPDINPLRK